MKLDYIAIILLILVQNIFPQVITPPYLPRGSQKASVSQTVGFTQITIEYSRPSVHGRKIWGDLVKYNQVWRTGANEATNIQFTTDVLINGNKVPAGRYSLFTIPTEQNWTVILNKRYDQWGAFEYKKEEDLLRFEVTPSKGEFVESLRFSFEDLTDNSLTVLFCWEKLRFSFKIEIDVVAQTYSKLKEAIANAKADDWHVFADGAEYLCDNNKYLDEALAWADKAVLLSNNYFLPFYVKAKVFAAGGRYLEAWQTLQKCRDAGRNEKDYEFFVYKIDRLEKEIKSKLK